jgi:hypothetical protein
VTELASRVPSARAHRLNEWAPALLFLTVYLAPMLFGPEFLRSMRSTALMQIFLWWAATGLAALLLTRADADPAATRRRVMIAGGIGIVLVLAAGVSDFVALAPALAMVALIVWNLWDAAVEGRDALRIERTLGLSMLPCLAVALLATQAIKPFFDHHYRSPELLTAGLLYAQLALLRGVLSRRARTPVRPRWR